MPRVTERYIQQRRRAILEAAWGCFARNGFHATTMDDVIAAAGVSSSVVYRWFRGKDELVAAAVSEALQNVVDVLGETLREDPPPPLATALEKVLTMTLERTAGHEQDLIAVAVQAWAEALRDPAVHQLIAEMYQQLRDGLAELIRRHQATGSIAADVDPDAAARPLFSLLPGFILQRVLLGPEDPKVYTQAAHAILRA